MVLQFDKQRIHLQVICGTLEKYEPTKEIENIQNKVLDLKDKLTKFREEVVYPALEEIDKLVEEENGKSVKKVTEDNK